MRIRSITMFSSLRLPLDGAKINELGQVARTASVAFAAAGYEVQTLRLATNFFPALAQLDEPDEAVAAAKDLESCCRDAGFEYVALGPAGPRTRAWVPEILRATDAVFATTHIVTPQTGTIDGQSIRASAEIIRAAAEIEDGFGNLRFAALANVRPGTPFFPAAYWPDEAPAFAIATESADLALSACRDAPDAAAVQARLTAQISKHGAALRRVGDAVAEDHALTFAGIDFSLAPYPDPDVSIGAALETLSGAKLGDAGTLAAAAILTHAVQSAAFPQAGFCGLMMPVLEDAILARRAAEGRLRLGELLMWSTVCGTGLDTVPLPGDVSEAALQAVLFDVATLSVRLNKPLTARLMPLPGKRTGDAVHFDFSYFADGGVLSAGEAPVSGTLVDAACLDLGPYALR